MRGQRVGSTVGMVVLGLILASPDAGFAQERSRPAGSPSSGAAVPRGGSGGGAAAPAPSGGGSHVSSPSPAPSGPSNGGGSARYAGSVPAARGARPVTGAPYRGQAAPPESRPRPGVSGQGAAIPRGLDGSDYSAVRPPGSYSNAQSAVGSRSATGNSVVGSAVPSQNRPRNGAPIVGTAVPRGSVPPAGGGYYPPYPGYYPPGYWGGYYPGYCCGYYPWWGWGGYLGWGFGLSWYYDPFWFGYGYPLSSVYPGYVSDYAGGSSEYGHYTGSVKLKVKPKSAEVYVDGYYAGIVDDFDGMYQDLKLSADPNGQVTHQIEIRAPNAQALSFEVRLLPGQSISYRGELLTTEPKR